MLDEHYAFKCTNQEEWVEKEKTFASELIEWTSFEYTGGDGVFIPVGSKSVDDWQNSAQVFEQFLNQDHEQNSNRIFNRSLRMRG